MKILVADDSKTNLALITDAINKLGHEVIPAHSGRQALEIYQENRPDLIILDVMMEDIDGFECAKQIRTIDREDWIPIIFLSGSVDDESIAKGIDAGGDDYLTKPFSEITLAAKIKAMQRISDMRLKLFEMTQNLYLMSSTDSLTGVYNRLQFDRSIKEILAATDRNHKKAALLFIDLDNFKAINDTFGHHIGDLLLIEVAKRLKLCVRSKDFISRLGGDEFAIILSDIEDTKEAEQIAEKIINTLSVDYNIEGHHIKNGSSIGVAFYPHASTTRENLVLNADVAMYHAKASGRNNFQVFSETLNDRYRKKISLEHALKFALERKEIFLTYQPIFNLKTNKICGVEALASWDHPTFGLVSPNIFIPIAEESGLINLLGEWILLTACKDASEWPLESVEDFRFCINISSRQLNQESFYQNVMNILRNTNLKPNQIEFELTETAVMSFSSQPFKDTIQRLHNLGIRISIDDFGTGYSSLVRLKHLPINTLKIEKSFIQDTIASKNGAIIVNCLIALGKNLGLNVIAEGIETIEQLKFLIDNECPYGQGFILSKPLDSSSVKKYLEEKINTKVKI